MLAVKAITKTEVKKILNKEFELPEDYPLKGILKDVATTILKCAGNPCTGPKGIKDLLSAHCIESEEELQEDQWMLEIVNLIKDGWTVYFGGFSDEGGEDPVELMLCNSEVKIEKENLILRSEEGY
jgi:hypothetical protein